MQWVRSYKLLCVQDCRQRKDSAKENDNVLTAARQLMERGTDYHRIANTCS